MPKPKKILNDAEHSVDEFLQGLLLQYPNHLQKLQNHKVIMARERHADQVQVICGGGSGHEPSHAGCVGAGFLTTAICGGVFASPPVASVLAAIRATAAANKNTTADQTEKTKKKKAGILVVIKNYTGDRLNFGMAAERAGQEGIPVQTVVVAEDCALPRTKGITGARGLAGTVLVNKVAGAAAAAGKSLDECADLARLVCRRMGTIGIALEAVTVPGAKTVNARLDEHTIEIGLGIHGEEGMRQSPLLNADAMAREMVTDIKRHGREVEDNGEKTIVPLFEKGDKVAILVNNLGGASNFEMSILARSCVQLLESDEFGVQARRVIVGCLMSSFDMHGASLTILNVTDHPEITQYLDAPTTAPAWCACDVWKMNDATRPSVADEVPEQVIAQADLKTPPLQIDQFEDLAEKMLRQATSSLVAAEPMLTEYDTVCGDGDCGFTMKRGALEVAKRLEAGQIPTDHPVTLFNAVADAVSSSMGGTSGVLLELLFRKISSHLSFGEEDNNEAITTASLTKAVQAGVDAVCLYGGASVGSRTMLDALIPAVQKLRETDADLEAVAHEASVGAFGTARMASASAGRANYISTSLVGTPDPGAVAVSTVFEALYEVVDDENDS